MNSVQRRLFMFSDVWRTVCIQGTDGCVYVSKQALDPYNPHSAKISPNEVLKINKPLSEIFEWLSRWHPDPISWKL